MNQELANELGWRHKWVLNQILRFGPQDKMELINYPGSPIGRGLEAHYLIKEIEDMGLIQSSLPNRDATNRVYSIVEGEDD